ncbi:hypothetical protein TNCV_3320811 [Trichonephila clavipes]|nr:hypothetical protein TNCV_3320811 [Trichonephila clavipes]
MLLWPARSPDLIPIEKEWDIIGRQRQRHPQPEEFIKLGAPGGPLVRQSLNPPQSTAHILNAKKMEHIECKDVRELIMLQNIKKKRQST